MRVDLIYSRLSGRGKVWVDTFGLLVFLLPVVLWAAWLSWQFFLVKLTTGMRPEDSVQTLGLTGYLWKLLTSGEVSGNAGGLIRWPAAALLPLGVAMLALQGVSELIKRFAALKGLVRIESKYERPVQ